MLQISNDQTRAPIWQSDKADKAVVHFLAQYPRSKLGGCLHDVCETQQMSDVFKLEKNT